MSWSCGKFAVDGVHHFVSQIYKGDLKVDGQLWQGRADFRHLCLIAFENIKS
jgi:hypothetical protein